MQIILCICTFFCNFAVEMRRLYSILFLIMVCCVCFSQHITRTIDPNIRTLRVRYVNEAIEPSGDVLRPYLVLQDGVVDGMDKENALEISFDELSHDTKQYTYRLLHCDRNWNVSQINSYEYLDGFTTNDIVDYELSNNTQQEYTHYWLEFPNGLPSFKTVYQRQNIIIT